MPRSIPRTAYPAVNHATPRPTGLVLLGLATVVGLASCSTATSTAWFPVHSSGGWTAVQLITHPEGPGELSRTDTGWLEKLGRDALSSNADPDKTLGAACRSGAGVPNDWHLGQTVTVVSATGPTTHRIADCRGDLFGHMVQLEYRLDPPPRRPALVATGAVDSDARVLAPAWTPAPDPLRDRVTTRLLREVPGIRAWAPTATIRYVYGDFGGPTGIIHARYEAPGCSDAMADCGFEAVIAIRPRNVLEVVSIGGFGPNDTDVGLFPHFEVQAFLRERRDGALRIVLLSAAVGHQRTEILQVSGGNWRRELIAGFIGG